MLSESWLVADSPVIAPGERVNCRCWTQARPVGLVTVNCRGTVSLNPHNGGEGRGSPPTERGLRPKGGDMEGAGMQRTWNCDTGPRVSWPLSVLREGCWRVWWRGPQTVVIKGSGWEIEILIEYSLSVFLLVFYVQVRNEFCCVQMGGLTVEQNSAANTGISNCWSSKAVCD